MANIVDGCVQGTLSRDLIMWARRENKTAASESVLFRPFRPLINRIKTTFIKIRENNSSVLNTETSEMDWGFLFCSDHEKWKKWEREEENGWVRQRARERVVMIEPSDTRKEARKKIECINQERERERNMPKSKKKIRMKFVWVVNRINALFSFFAVHNRFS